MKTLFNLSKYLFALVLISLISTNIYSQTFNISVSQSFVCSSETALERTINFGINNVNSIPIGTQAEWADNINFTGTAGVNVKTLAFPSVSTTFTLPAVAGNYIYYFRVKSACGTTSIINKTIEVRQTPTLNLLPSTATNLCEGNTLQLVANTVPAAGVSLSWSSNAGVNAPIINYSSGTTTKYSVTATLNGCSTAAESGTITHIANPVVSIASNPATNSTCPNSIFTITGQNANNYDWIWTDNGAQMGTSTNNSLTHTLSTIGTRIYYVTGTNTATTCKNTASYTISVNSNPLITLQPSAATICRNEQIQITANPQLNMIYNWSWSDGGNLNNVNPLVHNLNLATGNVRVYSITGTSTQTGCVSTATISINVSDLPNASIGTTNGINSVCEGTQTTLTASPNTGAEIYTWSAGATATTQNKATVEFLANPNPNTYIVTVQIGTGGCKNTAQIQITSRNKPTFDITTNKEIIDPDVNSKVCINDQITLNGNNLLYSYNWSSGQNNTRTINQTLVNSGLVIYSATATDINGCKAVVEEKVLAVDLPQVQLAPNYTNNSICLGETLSITAFVNGLTATAANCNWSSSGNILPQDVRNAINPITYTFNGATGNRNYILSATDANGCKNTANYSVSVLSVPMVSIQTTSGTNIVCEGSAGIILSANPNTFTNYQWAGPTGSTIQTNQHTATVQFIAPGTQAADNYTLTAYLGGCSAIATYGVISKPKPIGMQITTTNTSGFNMCQGTAITLNGNTGYSAYSWNYNDSQGNTGTTTAGQILNTGIISAEGTRNYILTVVNSSGCYNTTSQTITIYKQPTLTITSFDKQGTQIATNTLCSEGEIELRGEMGVSDIPATTTPYSWKTPSNAVINNSSTGIINLPLNIGTSNTQVIYTLTATSTLTTGLNCKTTAAYSISIAPVPQVSSVMGNLTACGNNPLTLTINTQNAGNYTYGWYRTGGGQADENKLDFTDKAIIFTPPYDVAKTGNLNDKTTYSYTFVAISNGCQSSLNTFSAKKIININSLPLAKIEASSGAICENGTITLTATGQGGNGTYLAATGYLWTGSNISYIPNNNKIIKASPNVLGTTAYNLTITDTQGCKSPQAEKIITLSTLPEVNITSSLNKICYGEEISLEAVPVNSTPNTDSNIAYKWKGKNSDNQEIGNGGPIKKFKPEGNNIALKYAVYTLTFTNDANCFTTKDYTITVSPIPSISSISLSKNNVCAEMNLSFTANTSVNCDKFEWFDKSNILVKTETTNKTNIYMPQDSGNHSYTVLAYLGNCKSDYATTTIEVVDPPTVSVSPAVMDIKNGHTSEEFIATAEGGNGEYTFVWSPSVNVLDPPINSRATAAPTDTTTFNVTVIDSDGCKSINPGQITINVAPMIKVINVFTPNNDGINDELIISGIEDFSENEVLIYNRWGSLIYQKSNYTNAEAWKGEIIQRTDKESYLNAPFKANFISEGIYFYLVKVKIAEKKAPRYFSGWIKINPNEYYSK